MAEQDVGVVFTQDGVPIRGAADYQKAFDSRWRFMEVFEERPVRASFAEVAALGSSADRYWEKVTLFNHNLGFIPLFETSIRAADYDNLFVEAWADKRRIFIRRMVTNQTAPAETVAGRIRVYNLPAMQEYVAPKGFPQGTSSPKSNTGMKFIDGTVPGVDIEDRSPAGFSVDTTKKILSVHRHGVAQINSSLGHTASVSAINTTSDVLTIGLPPDGYPYPTDISWFNQVGRAVNYFPNNGVTFPSPLTTNTTYYIIPVSPTEIKLATTRENALAGIAINLTTTGSLPGLLQGVAIDENNIFHGVGYPPTFLIAPTNWQDFYNPFPNDPETETYLGALLQRPPTFMRADKDNLSFFGVGSVFFGTFAYVFLKDPVEIAR